MTPGHGHGFGVWKTGVTSPAWTPAALGSSLKLWLKPESLDNPNLLAYSEDLSLSPWFQNGSMTASYGHLGPTGANDAWLTWATSSFHPLTQDSPTWQVGEDYTQSVWIKRGPLHNGLDRVRLAYRDGTTLTVWYFEVPPTTWTRVSGTVNNVAGANSQFYLYPTQSTSTDNAVLFWHPQLEQSSAVTSYVPNLTGTIGGIVAQWDDSSGTGNHVVEATQASMPLVQVDVLNGFSGAKYDGVDDRLTKVFTAFNQTFERWAVFVEATGGSTNGYFGSTPAANLQTTTAYYITAGTPMVMAGRTAGAHPRLTRSLFKGASSRGEGWNWNGSGSHVSTVGNAGTNNMVEIRTGYTSAAGPDFWYVEDILIQGELSAENRLNMIAYMAARYPALGI